MSNEQKLMHVALEAINALMIGAERDSDNQWGRICMPTNSAMSKGADAAMAIRQALATTEPAVNQQLTTEPLDERAAFESEMRSRHGWNNSYFTQSIDGGYLSNRATYAYIGWQARAALREKEQTND